MGSTEQHYSLRWNDYTVKIVTAFQSLRDEEDFVDVTVACDGHHYSAHKMVLSACSPYFRSLLRANPCQHPIVILKDVGHIEMERLLEFMYNGEVNIAQDQLAAFLKTAENLKIRGLAGSSEEMDQTHRDHTQNYSGCYSGATSTSGITSGRNSPIVGFASVQEKDDDLTETVFTSHTGSPASKRRKCSSSAPVVTTENITSHTSDSITSEGILDNGTDRPGNGGIDLDEDPRGDRRELKSEPSDQLGDVYTDASDLTSDPNLHPDGLDHRPAVYPLDLPGPSGSTVQDGISAHHSAAAPDGAVCEALNLSLRRAPATHQVNGSANSFPASVSIRRHHIQHSQYEHLQLRTPSNTVTLIPCTQVKTERDLDLDVDSVISPLEIAGASAAEVRGYSNIAMDLVCSTDAMASSTPIEHHGLLAASSGSLTDSSVAVNSASEYKTKIYPCPECHKVFRHPMSLHHHRHVHKGTYTCHSCGKVFSRRWDLHRHIHRSKMGCRRPNHTVSLAQGLNSAPHLDHPYDLNNPPSN